MKLLLIIPLFFFSIALFSQKPDAPCCTIIDMVTDAGTFTIRDIHSGKINVFKPDALEGAELKVGDSVNAEFDSKKITAVKGVPKSYNLLDAANGDSCCVILRVDSLMNEPSWRITAKNNTTGEKIHFNVPKSLAARLSAGSIVYTQSSHGYAMINAALTDTTQKILYGFPLLQKELQ
ncbi:MAG TPA: hypothetical protein VM101_04680 [Flavitalea sp.]|nr:hypothetical protein [Flavitalea sp.]